jgi:nucleotide-binding universal stress UspA family protein
MLPMTDPWSRGPSLLPKDLNPAAPVALRHVFAPSDFSDASDGAFDHARFLARRFGAHLSLYHAVEMSWSGETVAPAVDREVWRRQAGQAREFLGHRAETVPVGCETVVRRTRRPVLCVREPDHGVALPYRRVLVPTDLSPSSRKAFPMAALLASAFGAEVLALHVAPRPGLGSLSGVPEKVEAQVPDEARLEAFVAPHFGGLRVVTRVEMGWAWQAIVDTAAAEKADVIVMSTHGHDSLADLVLGSHTERVLRHAPCPVLVTW